MNAPFKHESRESQPQEINWDDVADLLRKLNRLKNKTENFDRERRLQAEVDFLGFALEQAQKALFAEGEELAHYTEKLKEAESRVRELLAEHGYGLELPTLEILGDDELYIELPPLSGPDDKRGDR